MRNVIDLLRPKKRAIVVVFAALLLSVPTVAVANHAFPDVLNSNPFHDEISAIAEAGITAGFGDGGYHPGDAVTRQAMAAFMHRGFGRVAMTAGTPETVSVDVLAGESTSPYVVAREVTIVVPGAPNAFAPSQIVYLDGLVDFYDSMSPGEGCPCEFIAFFRDASTLLGSLAQFQTFETSSGIYHHSFNVRGIFTAPPGSRTYQLVVGLAYRPGTTTPATFDFDLSTSATAMSFPFGPDGDSSL